MDLKKIFRNINGGNESPSAGKGKGESVGNEQFACINIEEGNDFEESARKLSTKEEEKGKSEEQKKRFFSWPKFSLRSEAKEVPEELKFGEDENLKMVNAKQLLRLLGVWGEYQCQHPGDGRVDAYSLLTLGRKLEEMGLGAMPDGRCPFRVKVDDSIAIFPKPEGMQLPLTYRSVQQTVLYLAAWLIQNGTPSEADFGLLDAWIDANAPKDRSSLPQKAMLRWLLSRKRILSKRVKTRATSQMSRFVHKRANALDLLLHLAVNNPQDELRIKNLEKIFPLFGLRAEDVHSELHRIATRPIAAKVKSQAKTAAIDRARLQEMEHNTLKAQEMLHSVFVEEEAEPAAKTTQKKSENVTETLYSKILERDEWTMEEFQQLIGSYGLSAMAALENLNEYSYELNDEPILEEDGNRLIVNRLE